MRGGAPQPGGVCGGGRGGEGGKVEGIGFGVLFRLGECMFGVRMLEHGLRHGVSAGSRGHCPYVGSQIMGISTYLLCSH